MVDRCKKSVQRWKYRLFCLGFIHRAMWIKLYTICDQVWKSQKNVAFLHLQALLIIVSENANIS